MARNTRGRSGQNIATIPTITTGCGRVVGGMGAMVGIIRVAPGTSRDYNPTVLPLYCTRFVEHLPAEVAPDEVAESVAENLPAKFPAKFFHGCPHVSNRSRGRIVVFQSLDDFRSRLPPAFSVISYNPKIISSIALAALSAML